MRNQRAKGSKWLWIGVLIIGLRLVAVGCAYGAESAPPARLVLYEIGCCGPCQNCPLPAAAPAAERELAGLCGWPFGPGLWYAGFVGFGLLVVLFDLLLLGRVVRSACRRWRSRRKQRRRE